MQHEVCTCEQTNASAALVLYYFFDGGVKENMQHVHVFRVNLQQARQRKLYEKVGILACSRCLFQSAGLDPLVWPEAAHDIYVIEPSAIDARPALLECAWHL
jgi:hypothetical protein